MLKSTLLLDRRWCFILQEHSLRILLFSVEVCHVSTHLCLKLLLSQPDPCQMLPFEFEPVNVILVRVDFVALLLHVRFFCCPVSGESLVVGCVVDNSMHTWQ